MDTTTGLYIHIPFCSQKCNYCNFHFSTQLKYKKSLTEAIVKELILRKSKKKLHTLYFGGGTPSILTFQELDSLFKVIKDYYDLSDIQEITLEANPDDLTSEYLLYLKQQTPINRLSIGIQSFFDKDLQLMNRAHNAEQSKQAIITAQSLGFSNISIDLIYGGQTTSNKRWEENLQQAINLNIPHISSYALTVEPRTVLEHQIKREKIPPISEDRQLHQFKTLQQTLTSNNFIQYELSNFGKEGFFSLHNTSYWQNKPYIGIGPSAHSFDGVNKRSWNIANNTKYINSINKNILPYTEEVISEENSYNETIMLGLRTIWGIKINDIEAKFSKKIVSHFSKEILNLEKEKKIIIKDSNILVVNPEFHFQTDGIISDLFIID